VLSALASVRLNEDEQALSRLSLPLKRGERIGSAPSHIVMPWAIG
jgi:hypothetical protein